jgi:FkbM family methyltransferase
MNPFKKIKKHLKTERLKKTLTEGFIYVPKCIGWQNIFCCKSKRSFSLYARDKIDIEVLHQIFTQEHYALRKLARFKDVCAIYEKIIGSGKALILDCGANIGAASVYFADQFPEAMVISIEPEPNNILMCKRNTSCHKNIQVLQAAVGSTCQKGEILDTKAENWGFQIYSASEGKIKIISINSLLKSELCQDTTPFIIKIDIEGFESDLFKENTEWMERFPLIIVELHDWMLPKTANSQNFLKAISKLDRDFVFLGENVFSISNKIG